MKEIASQIRRFQKTPDLCTMKSAQFSTPVKWPFHKSDISKQSTGTFPLQFSANLRQPGFMKSAFHGVPAQVERHKAPKCECEHRQRMLFCLARALPSQSMYIIAAMDRRGPASGVTSVHHSRRLVGMPIETPTIRCPAAQRAHCQSWGLAAA